MDGLEREARHAALRALPEAVQAELSSAALPLVLSVLTSWRGRQISRNRRRVFRSRELLRSSAARRHVRAIAEISRRLEAGGDLSRYLSKGAEIVYRGPDGTGRPDGDKDRLLAEWGVHHLHLGTGLDRSGRFVHRTRELLFLHINPAEAHLIGVYPHGAWTQQEVARIMVRNWGGLGVLHAARSGLSLKRSSTDQERAKLRAAGISLALEVDGVVYFPQGQTVAGTPLPAARQIMTFRAELERWRGEHGQKQFAAMDKHIAAEDPIGSQYPWEPRVAGGLCFFTKAARWRLDVARLPGVV